MAKKRHTAEQIISKLRETEVHLAKGTKASDRFVQDEQLWAMDTRSCNRSALPFAIGKQLQFVFLVFP